MLAGLLAPSSGRIEIDGEVMEATEGDFRWRIGFLPDRPPLYELMTVRGYDAAKLPRRLEEVMNLTQITPRADDPIQSLSQGFRQRVGIAQAVIHEPALVILDEPITGLDPVQLKEVRGLIRDLKAEHTVLLSSHNLHEVHETCDRLMVIEEGRLVFSGTEREAASRASAGGALRLTVRGAMPALRACLDSQVQAGLLSSWTAERSAGDDHTALAHLTSDAPERLAKAVVDAGLALRSMAPAADQLEDVFTLLTEAES